MLHNNTIVLRGAFARTQDYERLMMSSEAVCVKMQHIFTFDKARPQQMQLWISSYVSKNMMKRIHDQIFIDNVLWPLNETHDYQSIIITLRTPMQYDESEALIADIVKTWYEEECGAERRFCPLQISFNDREVHPDEYFQPQPLSRNARLGRVRAKMARAMIEENYKLMYFLSAEEKRLTKATPRHH